MYKEEIKLLNTISKLIDMFKLTLLLIKNINILHKKVNQPKELLTHLLKGGAQQNLQHSINNLKAIRQCNKPAIQCQIIISLMEEVLNLVEMLHYFEQG